jgi:hypothetical protein
MGLGPILPGEMINPDLAPVYALYRQDHRRLQGSLTASPILAGGLGRSTWRLPARPGGWFPL